MSSIVNIFVEKDVNRYDIFFHILKSWTLFLILLEWCKDIFAPIAKIQMVISFKCSFRECFNVNYFMFVYIEDVQYLTS